MQLFQEGNQVEKLQFSYSRKATRLLQHKSSQFVFQPREQQQDLDEGEKDIETQIEQFFKKCQRNEWNRKISIEGYKGTFKVEHFQMIETKFRYLWPLREISIIDTQMDKEHLIILKHWLQWLMPLKLQVELNNNELDDEDIEEFLYFLFIRGLDLKRLYIINNPGIYKGKFLNELKQFLLKKYSTNEFIEYQLIKNKECKSIAIIQMKKEWSKQEKDSQIQQSYEFIDQTCFYNLNFSDCFTKENYKGFIYLINRSYDQDNLEQISSLDVSNNYLGDQNSFQTACSQISTAKGLLDLKFRKVEQIKESTAAINLMGNRYDRLRINVFDISKVDFVQLKTLKIFVNQIFVHCKELYLKEIFQYEPIKLSTIQAINKAFFEKQKDFTQNSLKEGFLKKYSMKFLDLSDLEMNKRNDLVSDLLNNLVFTEHSNIKKLGNIHSEYVVCQDLTDKLKLYNQAIQAFGIKIMQQVNSIKYLNCYKHPLKSISIFIHEDLDEALLLEFFRFYCFTIQGEILQIQQFQIDGLFLNPNPAPIIATIFENFQSTANQNFKCTLKSIKFSYACTNFSFQIYKCLLLQNCLHLEELTVQNDKLSEKFEKYFFETQAFLNQIPAGSIHSLTTLCLSNIQGQKLDLHQFIQLFFYNSKIRLQKLELRKVRLCFNSKNKKNLEKSIAEKEEKFDFSISELIFGEFKKPKAEQLFFKYVLLKKYSKIQRLQVVQNQFNKNINSIEKYLSIFKRQNKQQPFQELNYLCLQSSNETLKFESWQIILGKIVFAQNSLVAQVVFNEIVLNTDFLKEIKPISQEKTKVSLQKIAFKQCIFETEFLTNLLKLRCPITELEIINCRGVNESITQSMNICNENEKYYEDNQFHLENLTLQGWHIEDTETFQWFLHQIIYNKGKIRLKKLHLNNCNLDAASMEIVIQFIKLLKSKFSEKEKFIFLRSINLENNKFIDESTWKLFIDEIIEFEQIFKLRKIKTKTLSEKKIKQGKMSRLNCLSLHNSEFASTHLRINKKIYNDRRMFTPQYYRNLSSLQLDLKFDNFNLYLLNETYNKIMAAFIIQPQSRLTQLKLFNVDLIIFERSAKNILQQYPQSNKSFQSPIKDFVFQIECSKRRKKYELNTINNHELKDSVEDFVNTFICSNAFNFEKLTLSGFNQIGLISSLVNQISKKKKLYKLKNFSLIDIEEDLTDGQTIKFIEHILLGNIFQTIEKISICKMIKLFPCLLQDLIIQQMQFATQIISLKEFAASIGDNYIQIYSKIIQLLFTKNCCLTKISLTIEKNSNFNSIFNDLFQEINVRQGHFKIKEFVLIGELKFNLKMLQFIYSFIQTLQFLHLSDVNVNELEQKLPDFDSQEIRNGSLISIKKVKGYDYKIQQFLEEIVFNDKYGFSQVEFQDKLNFYKIKNIQTCSKLQSIKLDMQSQQNTLQDCNFEFLTHFSKKFIYNENSDCNEIYLYNWQFSKKEMQALLLPADEFRRFIEREKRERQVKLSLTKFHCQSFSHFDEIDLQALISNIYFFEYISIEELTLKALSLTNETCRSLILSAKKWMDFQIRKQRQESNQFSLKYLDLSENHFISEAEVWYELLSLFIFSSSASNLQVCNLSDMAINDKISEFFKNQSDQYFKQQSGTQLTIRVLDLSKNYFLTKVGWKNILEYFILHPKVFIDELNLNSTTEIEDVEENLDVIYKCFKQRAMQSNNNKVPIQKVYCQNEILKAMISQYLNEGLIESNRVNQTLRGMISQQLYDNRMSETIILKQDLLEFDTSKKGLYFSLAEKFGVKVQTINRMLCLQTEFIQVNQQENFEDLKFSCYQLSFSKHFLQVLDKNYQMRGFNEITIYLSLLTLNSLCSIFKYCINEPGDPYPYKLIFQEETFDYLKSQQCQIYQINIIQTEFSNLETIKQKDILQLWRQIRQSRVDQIWIEYEFHDDLCEMMLSENYTENDIIQLVRILPPSKLRLQGGLTLSALKGVYSILFQIPYFQYSLASYEFDTFINTGIGYALRESVYKWKETGAIKNFFKKILYKFFNFFVSPTIKYKFDIQILKLNRYLQDNRFIFLVIALNNLVFLFAALFLPYIFNHFYLNDESSTEIAGFCINGANDILNYIYYGFLAFSFIIEAILFYLMSMNIRDHLDKFELKIGILTYEEEQQTEYLGQKEKKNCNFLDRQQTINQENNVELDKSSIINIKQYEDKKQLKVENAIYNQELYLSVLFQENLSSDIYQNIQDLDDGMIGDCKIDLRLESQIKNPVLQKDEQEINYQKNIVIKENQDQEQFNQYQNDLMSSLKRADNQKKNLSTHTDQQEKEQLNPQKYSQRTPTLIKPSSRVYPNDYEPEVNKKKKKKTCEKYFCEIFDECPKFIKIKWKQTAGKIHPILFIKNTIKQILNSNCGVFIFQFVNLVKSCLYKLDLYNDAIFILTCKYCEEFTIFYFAISITLITQLFYLYRYLKLLFIHFEICDLQDSFYRQLSTSEINKMYTFALLGRNQAIADLLDRVAPFNITNISNCRLVKYVFPKYAGKSLSNSVLYYFLQFWFEDLPQTILQTYFAVKQALSSGTLSSQITIIIITTVFTLFTSFYSFMAIRPSTINQQDFDNLSKEKKVKYFDEKYKWLQQEQKQLQFYSDLFSKSLRLKRTQSENLDLFL